MSKVEDLARKYCEGSSFEDAVMERPAYIAGYKQAEKDNALTWEDIGKIIYLDQEACAKYGISYYVHNHKEVMKEVLKRFNEEKDKI